jgi:hypothetical protein
MNSIITQLHAAPEDARTIAERLVGGKFVSPLGGEYALMTPSLQAGDTLPGPGERRLWASTATPTANRFLLTEIPADYRMPMLDWFRGIDFDLTRNDAADSLSAHAELDMVHQEVGPPEDIGNGATQPANSGILGGLLNRLNGAKQDEKQPVPQPLPPPERK